MDLDLDRLATLARATIDDFEMDTKIAHYLVVRRCFAELIDVGALIAGAQFPAERDLHVAIGVSRSTLREALTLLEAEG